MDALPTSRDIYKTVTETSRSLLQVTSGRKAPAEVLPTLRRLNSTITAVSSNLSCSL
jgi:hypothetical protein